MTDPLDSTPNEIQKSSLIAKVEHFSVPSPCVASWHMAFSPNNSFPSIAFPLHFHDSFRIERPGLIYYCICMRFVSVFKGKKRFQIRLELEECSGSGEETGGNHDMPFCVSAWEWLEIRNWNNSLFVQGVIDVPELEDWPQRFPLFMRVAITHNDHGQNQVQSLRWSDMSQLTLTFIQ
mmetsp:Transcript_11278/g.42248  ORF Transcript_11278/g.42248 Transcript_11278/m.42248 type:complete len:178 (+) Transcript_11278:186-719(+)